MGRWPWLQAELDSREFTAYATGLFDGEGSVWIGRSGTTSFQRFVTLAQRIDRCHVLLALQARWGGAIYAQGPAQMVWTLTRRADLVQFIREVWPLAIIKRKELDVLWRFLQLGSARRPQERALFELELRQYRRLPESPVRLKVYARADDEVPLSDEEVTRYVKGEGLLRHE